MNELEYKRYVAEVAFDTKAKIFHGRVINTRDVITFQGRTISDLTIAFHESVDDYLAFCNERGEFSDTPIQVDGPPGSSRPW